jgi:hypothetical protein
MSKAQRQKKIDLFYRGPQITVPAKPAIAKKPGCKKRPQHDKNLFQEKEMKRNDLNIVA